MPLRLPDPLRTLAKSNDAFADSMAKLDDETEAVANYAERVHKVALNEAARANILDTMSSALKQGMPDASAYDEAETNALNAAAAYKTSPSAATKAALQAAVAKAEDASNALVEATRAHVRQVAWVQIFESKQFNLYFNLAGAPKYKAETIVKRSTYF